ncbi:MAG: CsgG/HfaB family protein, partial [Myxococcota bacterium]
EAKIDAMATAAAEERYRTGEARLAARAWEEAIGAYKAAQGFRHGYRDSAEKVAAAYYGWAEDELAARRYRSAAERWSAATESAGKGYRDAARRGGTVYAALGRHFVTADRCRQAVRDLRVARQLDASLVADAELAAAEECAVTPVAILPFENPTGQNIAGMAIGDTLAEKVGGTVQDGASEFVRLLERTALDTILAEQNLSTSGLTTGGASRLRGVRYLVLGKLTQVRLDQPTPTTTAATATGQERYGCMKKRSDGATYEGTCFRDYPIRYVDHRARVEVRLAGSVKVVDVKTGEQVTTVPFEVSMADAVHYATNFASAGGSPVTPVGRGRTGGIEVDDDFLALVEARRDLVDEGQLLQKVLTKVAADAGSEVLEAIDVEREATDPLMVSL